MGLDCAGSGLRQNGQQHLAIKNGHQKAITMMAGRTQQRGQVMKNILLATDLGSNSDRAMERALSLAKHHHAALTIVHIAPSPPKSAAKNPPSSDQHPDQASDQRAETEALIRRYVNNYKDASAVSTTIIVKQGGEVFFEILEAAYAHKAELIVIGTHGKERFRDLFVGTTIERILRKGILPVLMVKGKAAGAYQSVLSAVDFAPSSRTALRFAASIAPKARFTAGHVVVVPTVSVAAHGASFAYEFVRDSAEKNAKSNLSAFVNTEKSHFADRHQGQSLALTGVLLEGGVSNTLARTAESLKADLITIGTHSQPEFTFKLGGVAGDILANPPCDVLVTTEHLRL